MTMKGVEQSRLHQLYLLEVDIGRKPYLPYAVVPRQVVLSSPFVICSEFVTWASELFKSFEGRVLVLPYDAGKAH